jgi:hypothetical protein
MTLTLTLDPIVAAFYARAAELLSLPVEVLLSDVLFKLAGELSLEALAKKDL